MIKKFVALFALLALIVVAAPGNTSAAACTNSTYGSSSLSVNVPQAGMYKLWFRMLPSGSNNGFDVEVDGGTCLSISANGSSWGWVAAQSVYDFKTAGNHTLKLMGTKAAVSVDRIILLSATDNCVPDQTLSGNTKPGDNCLSSSTTTTQVQNNTGSGKIITTPTGQKIQVAGTAPTSSGNVVLDPTIVTDEAKVQRIQKVEYYVNGKLTVTITQPPFSFDSTVLDDGTYTITEKVYFKDGTTQEKTATITISNNKPSQKSRTLSFTLGFISTIVVATAVLVIVHRPTRERLTLWAQSLRQHLPWFKRWHS